MISENDVYPNFCLVGIFHDTEGPITKIGANCEKGEYEKSLSVLNALF